MPTCCSYISGATVPIPDIHFLALSISVLFYIFSRKTDLEIASSKDATWLLQSRPSAFGTLPYLFSNTIPSFTDAFFESASGFSRTTGSSSNRCRERVPFCLAKSDTLGWWPWNYCTCGYHPTIPEDYKVIQHGIIVERKG